MEELKITLIQSDIFWEDIQANLSAFEEKIWQIREATDVILLPEMFTTGFSMNAPLLAEPENFKTFKWMRQQASQTGALIIGSYIIKEQGKYFNRLFCVPPEGNPYIYDKRHPFRMSNEHLTFEKGSRRLIVPWKGWNLCPMICYDLRFPVWSRNTFNTTTGSLDYDVLLFLGNWPESRIDAWYTLLKARALENLCFSAGINRTGTGGDDTVYNGHSGVFDFKGKSLMGISGESCIHTVTLKKKALQEFRQKFPAFLDSDPFNLI